MLSLLWRPAELVTVRFGPAPSSRDRIDDHGVRVGPWPVAIARPAAGIAWRRGIGWRRTVGWRRGIGWRRRAILCIRRLHPNGRSHDGDATDSEQSALHDLPPFEEQHAMGIGFIYHRQRHIRQAPVAERPVALPPVIGRERLCLITLYSWTRCEK
jgi:hypothetical protein